MPGLSLTRGDIFIDIDNSSAVKRVDIDQLNISQADKAILMQEALTGYSGGFSGGFYFLQGGGSWSVSKPLEPSKYVMTEAGISGSPFPGGFVSPIGRTWLIYSK
jgi:hypothetical protein